MSESEIVPVGLCDFSQFKCEEDFFVLKFPVKLWRIVNGCQTMAISWGQYGNTILIDYNSFQDEYLKCEVPKFKTQNMTSFVRQLNMYGFKKCQNQLRNSSVHEFRNEYFRFGRSDLLRFVKRRVISMTGVQRKMSRLEHCRREFDELLQGSQVFRYFWDLSKCRSNLNFVEGGLFAIDPEYNIQVIAVENATFIGELSEFWGETDGDCDGLLQLDPNEYLEKKTESEHDCTDDDDTISIPSIDGHFGWSSAKNSVKVKSGFDGSCFTIEIVKDSKESLEGLQGEEENEMTNAPTIQTLQEAPSNEPQRQPDVEDVSAPTMHLPDSDGENDLFSCLSNALTLID